MSESRFSLAFVNDQRKLFKRAIFIDKVIRPDKKGEPDIQGVFRGMHFEFECKIINSKSFTNLHEFTDIQIDTLKVRSLSGAVCLGLLFCDDEIRYLFPHELKNILVKADWDKAKKFDFQALHFYWLSKILPNV